MPRRWTSATRTPRPAPRARPSPRMRATSRSTRARPTLTSSGAAKSIAREAERQQIDGGQRAPGPEALAEIVHVGERRVFELPDARHRSTQRQVPGRPDVGPAEGEQEHAVGGEPAHALDLGERVAGGVIVQAAEPREVEPPIDETLGEVVEIDRLGAGEPDPEQGALVDGEQLLRRRQPAAL